MACDSYVAEMMANRVLRFVQRPAGVFHCSVFKQLSGGLGPSALALRGDGALFVAQYDIAGAGLRAWPQRARARSRGGAGTAAGARAQGTVLVVDKDGRTARRIRVPAQEVTGLAFRCINTMLARARDCRRRAHCTLHTARSESEGALYITEASTNTVFRVAV